MEKNEYSRLTGFYSLEETELRAESPRQHRSTVVTNVSFIPALPVMNCVFFFFYQVAKFGQVISVSLYFFNGNCNVQLILVIV